MITNVLPPFYGSQCTGCAKLNDSNLDFWRRWRFKQLWWFSAIQI